MDKLRCAKAPCKSCPYRTDVPSGVWAAHEYTKLPHYDGTIMKQLKSGKATAAFMCHQNDGKLCAGWVGCHGATNLLALRLSDNVHTSVWRYQSPVPLFKSGKEESAHGKRDIRRPGERARNMVVRLMKKQARQRGCIER